MPLKQRLTLLAAGTVGVTVMLASLICWLAMRGELRQQVDDALSAQAARITQRPLGLPIAAHQLPGAPARFGGSAPYAQLLGRDGTVRRIAGSELPVTDADRQVVAGSRAEYWSDGEVDEDSVRILTTSTDPDGPALQLARSLEPVNDTLGRLRLVLGALCVLGTGFAAAVGRLFSRTVVKPVTDLTEAAEHISATEDLGRRIDASGDDEVGRMAKRFNTMLDTLAISLRAQRQLVADASHELRTPITSLRTNIEVLLESPDLREPERTALLTEVREQAEELGLLITDVIELARGDEPLSNVEDVGLDALVAEAVERARRHRPSVTFETDLAPSVVEGMPDRLGRAINNLLDNAAKHSPPGGTVEVAVRDGEIAVRDHGPGVAPEDRPFIFDRFRRGANADAPGSGLGLAIVRQVAEAHGGHVTVEDAPGGGALFRLRLP